MKEYNIEFQPSVWEDIYAISSFIMKIAYIEDVRYVSSLILNAMYELENPFLSGSFPYSNEIADRGFLKYTILEGSYIVFFKENRRKKIRTIYYVKSARSDYRL